MKDLIMVSVIWFFMVAWWGTVCPEFAFTKECVEKINAESGLYEEFLGEEDFLALLSCPREQIEVKSKLLEWLKEWQ